MKSYVLHYRNKYPGGQVQASETALDVYDHKGNHCIALRKNGAGQWMDESAAQGCIDKHDLAPIPKDSRLYKEDALGRFIKDEEFEARAKKVKSFLDDSGRFVLSCDDLKKKGYQFDDKQRVIVLPQA